MFIKEELQVCCSQILFWTVAIFLPIFVYGQQVTENPLRKSDVLNDPSKPGIVTCVENPLSGKGIKIRITNNYVWTLQFPVENGGTHDGTRKLSNNREVAILADNTIFFPYFSVESKNGQSLRGYAGHVGTRDFLIPNRTVTFSLSEKQLNGNRVYLDFNYEWELDTIYLASPRHRVYIEVDARSLESNKCLN